MPQLKGRLNSDDAKALRSLIIRLGFVEAKGSDRERAGISGFLRAIAQASQSDSDSFWLECIRASGSDRESSAL
jgi:hypothetical protein